MRHLDEWAKRHPPIRLVLTLVVAAATISLGAWGVAQSDAVVMVGAIGAGLSVLTPALLSFFGQWDREQNAGAAVLALVMLALLIAILMVFWDEGAPVWRVSIPVVLLATAIFFASSNWRRVSLRITVVIGALLVMCSLVSIGRDAPASRALDELTRSAAAVTELDGAKNSRIVELIAEREDAFIALKEQIAASQAAEAEP